MSTIDNLIKLSEIFKEGFTVEIKDGKISQYNNIDRPYIVSYKTLIKVYICSVTGEKIIKFKGVTILENCIVGGWLDTNTNIYYIEINLAFHNKRLALIFGKNNKQKYIYDLKNQKVIKVEYTQLH